MTLTKHGHHIPGTTTANEQTNPMVHRCGGPEICGPCARDVTMHWHPTNSLNRESTPVAREDRSLELLVADYRQAEADRDDAHKAFLSDQIEKILHRDDLCPTCTGPVRETVNMKCPDCGKDYS